MNVGNQTLEAIFDFQLYGQKNISQNIFFEGSLHFLRNHHTGALNKKKALYIEKTMCY